MDIETKQSTTAIIEGEKVKVTLTREDIMSKETAKETFENLKKQADDLTSEIAQLEKELEPIKEGWLPHLRKLQQELDKINKLQNIDNIKSALKDKAERLTRVNEALAIFEKVIHADEDTGSTPVQAQA